MLHLRTTLPTAVPALFCGSMPTPSVHVQWVVLLVHIYLHQVPTFGQVSERTPRLVLTKLGPPHDESPPCTESVSDHNTSTARPAQSSPSRVSSVDEVLTLLRSKRAPQHRLASLSAGEERGRRSA